MAQQTQQTPMAATLPWWRRRWTRQISTATLAVLMTLELTVWPQPGVNIERTIAVRKALAMGPVDMTKADKAEVIAKLGVGLWLWQPRGRHDPDAAKAALQLRQLGVGHVLVKAHDGCKPFRASQAKTASQYAAYRAAGLTVLAWGYNYANDCDSEAGLVIRQLDDPNTVGYVFNTEKDVANKFDAVEQLLAIVHDHQAKCLKCRGKLLGFAPYAYPYNHPALPHRELLAGCDFVSPQLYWAEMKGHDVNVCVDRAQNEWQRLMDKLDCHRPIVGLGQAFNSDDGSPRPGEIAAFAQKMRDAGFAGIEYWLWQQIASTEERRDEVAQAAVIWPAAGQPVDVQKTSGIVWWLIVEGWLAVAFLVTGWLWGACHASRQRCEHGSQALCWYAVLAGLAWPIAYLAVLVTGWAIIAWFSSRWLVQFGRWAWRHRPNQGEPQTPLAPQ